MDIEGISITQVLTVGIFLLGMVALQVFVTKNKSKFSRNWRSSKRIQLIEEKSLSSSEKLRIISVDSSQFLLISNKGKKSSLIPLEPPQSNSSIRSNGSLVKGRKQQKIPSRSSSNNSTTKASKILSGESAEGHQLSRAIQKAREMNPAVSYRS